MAREPELSLSGMVAAVEAPFFRSLNHVVLPAVRRGFGAPWLTPWGLVVLEHRGRKSGREYAAPLVAARVGRTLVVSTVRPGRSQWLRNLAANRSADVWLRGKQRHVRARVVSGVEKPQDAPKGFPSAVVEAARAAGLGLAILTPTRPRQRASG